MYRTTQSPLVTQLATRMIMLVIIHSQLIKWSMSLINFVKDWIVIVSVTGVLIPVDFNGVKKMMITQGDNFFPWLNCDEILWQKCDIFYCHPVTHEKTPSSPFDQRRAFNFSLCQINASVSVEVKLTEIINFPISY